MKLSLSLLALVLVSPAFAADPLPLGNFEGVEFTSPTVRHSFKIHGGTLAGCEQVGRTIGFMKCHVQNGFLEVGGDAATALRVDFTTVTVFRTDAKSTFTSYYFRGLSNVVIGPKTVSAPVLVRVGVDDPQPDRLVGSLELADQYAKTSLEAYRVQ